MKKCEWRPIRSKEDLPNPELYDWVLVRIEMVPEKYYGVPKIAEYRKDGWYDSDDRNIETAFSVKVTDWMPIPGDEQD